MISLDKWVAVYFVAFAIVSPAAAQTWTGVINSDWNTAGNWTPATIPNGGAVAVSFPTLSGGSPNYALNISGSVQAQSLTFSNTAGSYNLTSSTSQTLSGLTNINVVNGVTTADTINLASNSAGNLLFTGNLTIANNAAASTNPTLVIGPNTVIGTPGFGGISVSGTGTTLISGTFAAGGNQVIGGLSVSGPGILELTGNNAFLAGPINVTGGFLSISADSALGPTSNGVGLNGGTLQLTGGGVITELAAGRTITIGSSGGTFDTSALGAGGGNVITIASPIVGNGPVTLNANGDTSNSGNGSNSELMLNGADTFLGNVTIGSGVVDASSTFGNSANTISIAGGGLVATATQSFARNITLTGTGDRIFRVYGGQTLTLTGTLGGTASLRKTDSGTLLLPNATTYGGSTTIGGGVIQAGIANALPTGTDLTVNAGTTLNMNGFAQTLGSLAGGGTVQLGTGGGSLTAGGDNASTSFTGVITGTGPFTKAGAGSMTLGTANTYTASTTINGGTLQLGIANALPTGTDVTLANTAGAALNLNGFNQTIGSLAGGGPAGGNVALGSGTLTAGGDNATTTFGGTFSGTGTFSKVGTGAMTFTGSGSSAGSFLVNAGSATTNGGSLTVTGTQFAAAVGGGATWTITGGANVNASSTGFVSNGPAGTGAVVTGAGTQLNAGAFFVGFGGIGNLTVASGGSATSSNALELGTVGGDLGTLLIQSGGLFSVPTQYLGIFSGATGTATVTGAGSTLTATTLILGSDGANAGGVGQLTVSNGGSVTNAGTTLIGTSASSITVNGGTFSTGSLALVSGATPSLTLSDPATGGFAMTIGTDNSSTTWALPIADATGGPGTVNKVRNGTLTLAGHLTNTGGYTATAGKIDFSGATVQPGTGTLTAAGGATIQYDGGARIIGGFLAGPGTHAVNGASFTGVTSSPSAAISVTGPATFVNFSNGGPLNVSAPAASPTTLTRFTNAGSGSITLGQNSQVNASDFQSYGTLTLNPGSFNGSSGSVTQLTNTGSSDLYFNGGSRTFISTPAQVTNSNAGIDLHGNDAIVAGGLLVNNGYVYDSVGSGQHRIIADYGSLVKGAGFYQQIPRTINGGTFLAGNSPGRATTGAIVLGGPNDPNQGLSSYTWEINDAGPSGTHPNAPGTMGPQPNAADVVSGWGLLSAVSRTQPPVTSGNFSWDATPTDPLTIHMQTMQANYDAAHNPTLTGGYEPVGDNTLGLMADFDPTQSYSWRLFDYAGTYTGPTDTASLDASTIFDDANFQNSHPGRFDLVLNQTNQEMDLLYTPAAVPEPGTLLLSVLGIGVFGGIRRRRG